MGLQIYANIDAVDLQFGRVQSATDLRPKAFRQFPVADSTTIDLYLTGQDGTLNIQDYPTIQLGVGSLSGRPSSGTWKMLVGAETPIAYDSSAAALEAIISSDINPCEVALLAPYVYKVKFDSVGEQIVPSVNAEDLEPNSSANIARFKTGDATTKEAWLIRLFKNPLALTNSWTNIEGGVRGTLALGTPGIYELIGSNSSASSTLELELTDLNGDITTIFQVQIKIVGEVIGQGATGVAAFGAYATASQLVSAMTRSNYIIVSAQDGSDATGLREREDRPFATPSAAFATANSGDVIVIRDGNFSNDAVTLPDAVTVAVNPSAIGPVCSTTATNQSILVGAFSGLIHQSTGTTTLGAVDMNFIDVQSASGNVSITNSKIAARDIETQNAIQITGGCRVRIDNSLIESENAGEAAIQVSTFTGSLFLSDCEVSSSATTATLAADACEIVSTLTGSVQIKDCTLIGTSTGTYLAKAIKADTDCTVQIQGSLSSNVDVSSEITLEGGMFHINPNFDI